MSKEWENFPTQKLVRVPPKRPLKKLKQRRKLAKRSPVREGIMAGVDYMPTFTRRASGRRCGRGAKGAPTDEAFRKAALTAKKPKPKKKKA